MKLYTYWRSQAAFRVRIALHLKGLDVQLIPIDILKGDQFAAAYRALNPEMVVPTFLLDDGAPLLQSLAILEYLDEAYPEPPLLPRDIRARAHVRALAYALAVDAHPFVVPRVRTYLERELRLDEAARFKWLRHWLDEGLRVVEALLARDPRTGRFCCGEQPSLADICLAAYVTSALALPGYDVSPYPTVKRIFDECMKLDAFAQTQPLKQPDAPRSK